MTKSVKIFGQLTNRKRSYYFSFVFLSLLIPTPAVFDVRGREMLLLPFLLTCLVALVGGYWFGLQQRKNAAGGAKLAGGAGQRKQSFSSSSSASSLSSSKPERDELGVDPVGADGIIPPVRRGFVDRKQDEEELALQLKQLREQEAEEAAENRRLKQEQERAAAAAAASGGLESKDGAGAGAGEGGEGDVEPGSLDSFLDITDEELDSVTNEEQPLAPPECFLPAAASLQATLHLPQLVLVAKELPLKITFHPATDRSALLGYSSSCPFFRVYFPVSFVSSVSSRFTCFHCAAHRFPCPLSVRVCCAAPVLPPHRGCLARRGAARRGAAGRSSGTTCGA